MTSTMHADRSFEQFLSGLFVVVNPRSESSVHGFTSLNNYAIFCQLQAARAGAWMCKRHHLVMW